MRRIHDVMRRSRNKNSEPGGVSPRTENDLRCVRGLTPPGSLRSRAGFTLLEMFVAAVVFGTALVTFLPMMQSVGFQQRLTEQRLLALREAENLLEQLAPRKWSELTTEELAKLSLSENVKSRLPQAVLKVAVNEPADPASSKRVAVQLSWTSRTGQAPQSVHLAAWFFETEGQP